jgi:hypothetical protein
MKKCLLLYGALFAAIMIMALPEAAYAQRAYAKHNLGLPDYERTAPPGEETMLVHTKSPGMHTVCQTLRDNEKAVIRYDNNEVTLGPGHCVEVEASYITAKPESASAQPVGVYGYHHVFKERPDQ